MFPNVPVQGVVRIPAPGGHGIPCRRWYRCHVDLSTFLPGLPQLPAPSTEGSNTSSRDDHARAAAAVSGGFMRGAANVPPIPVISDASGMSAEEFEARFDAPRCPALLGGLTAGWPGEWGRNPCATRCLAASRVFCCFLGAPSAPPPHLSDLLCTSLARASWYTCEHSTAQYPYLPVMLLPAGGLEAWQPARLAQLFGDELLKVTKPFMAAGKWAGKATHLC